MRYPFLSISSKTVIIPVVFSLFFAINLSAQDESKEVKEEVKIAQSAFSINTISLESERVNKQLSSYKDILVPSGTIVEVDSILDIIYKEIILQKDSLLIELETISRRDLKIKQVTWQNNKSELKSFQKNLNDRIEEVNDISKK